MARFGRDIVKQLTDPTMGQGMFEIGRQIGGLPGERRKKKTEEQEKEALITLENQLRQTATASAEAARLGDVDAINLQLKSIDEQLKTERNEVKRQRLTEAYTLLSQNLNTARQVKGKTEATTRSLEVGDVARGGELSYEDGNLVGVIAARDEVRKRLATESNERVQSELLTTLETLNSQIDGISVKKSERNIQDLMKAEALYDQLEAKGSTRTDNESKIMAAVKQRIDQLKEDPDTVRVVKEQKGKQRLARLTQDNQIQAAEETRGIAILSSLDPKSDKYQTERQRLINNNLGNAVKKVEKAQQEAETAKLNYEKLLADVRPAPLTKEQRALGEKYGVIFREGASREDILTNRELLKSTLKQVSEMGTKLALRDVEPLDEPAARAKLNVMLTDLEEQGDLSFAKDFFMTDLEDDLRDLSEKDQQYLVDSILNKKPEEAEQIVLDFVQRKFPESFERTQTEKTTEAEYEQSLRNAMQATFDNYPELDPDDPVDQAKVMEAANKQLRQAMGVPTASEIFLGETQEYDQRRGRRQ